MSSLVIYEKSGNIVSVVPGFNEETMEKDIEGLLTLVWEGKVGPNSHYVENHAVKPLKVWDLKANVTPKKDYYSMGIEPLPKGTRVTWPDGVVETVDDGRVICDVNLPGSYRFLLQHLQYPRHEVTINVA